MRIPRDVIRVAVDNGGYASRDQLINARISPSTIDRLVNDQDLTVVSSGVYQVIPSDDHIDLLHGVLLAMPGAVVSHQSAAHLLRLPKLPRLVSTVTVASHTTHRFPGVTIRRNDDLDESHNVNVAGLSCTNVVRTLFDLAGILKFREFDAIAEEAILGERLSLQQYESMVEALARRGKRGSRASRDFIAMRLGTHSGATVLEKKGRALLLRSGLPKPSPQFPLPWDPERRFDDAYPTATLAIEWDSRAWHEQRSTMRSDRMRDREAATHGWQIVRVTWHDLDENTQEVVNTVATLLESRSPKS